jgi:hypothetical protein
MPTISCFEIRHPKGLLSSITTQSFLQLQFNNCLFYRDNSRIIEVVNSRAFASLPRSQADTIHIHSLSLPITTQYPTTETCELVLIQGDRYELYKQPSDTFEDFKASNAFQLGFSFYRCFSFRFYQQPIQVKALSILWVLVYKFGLKCHLNSSVKIWGPPSMQRNGIPINYLLFWMYWHFKLGGSGVLCNLSKTVLHLQFRSMRVIQIFWVIFSF